MTPAPLAALRRAAPLAGLAFVPVALRAARCARGCAGAGEAAPCLLWRFGRPHTLIGTTLSVLGVYVLVAIDVAEVGDRLGDLLARSLAASSVNVFITGINQLEDVEIDRINKPFLPIAAGDLSPARRALDRRRVGGAADRARAHAGLRSRSPRSSPVWLVGVAYSLAAAAAEALAGARRALDQRRAGARREPRRRRCTSRSRSRASSSSRPACGC